MRKKNQSKLIERSIVSCTYVLRGSVWNNQCKLIWIFSLKCYVTQALKTTLSVLQTSKSIWNENNKISGFYIRKSLNFRTSAILSSIHWFNQLTKLNIVENIKSTKNLWIVYTETLPCNFGCWSQNKNFYPWIYVLALPVSFATLSLSSHSWNGPRHLARYVWSVIQSKGSTWLSAPTCKMGSTTM